ncbi:hypothetical protein M514_09640 [Trichuris suis]|uniref:Uncharacterized protein n=1 Tax=Trichuris suis TaxID=68888 RepID=A0A085NJS5_9BILA|nr:hypothetical protein M514_09640 [Trichuris suis]
MQTTILCAVALLTATWLQTDADSRTEKTSPYGTVVSHVVQEDNSGKSRQLVQTTERNPIDAIFNAFRSLTNSYRSGDPALILQPVHLTIDEVFNAVRTFPQTYSGGQKLGQPSGPRTRRPPVRPRPRDQTLLTSRPEYVAEEVYVTDSNRIVKPKKCRPRQRGCQPAEDNGQTKIKDVPASVLPQGESSYVEPLEVARS